MAGTRTVNGKTQWYWNGNWHTVPQPTPMTPAQYESYQRDSAATEKYNSPGNPGWEAAHPAPPPPPPAAPSTPSAAAPSTPTPTPTTTPDPWQAIRDRAIQAAGQPYNDYIAKGGQYDQQTQLLASNYGYGYTNPADSSTFGLVSDNPFSQAALLKQHFQQAQSGDLNSLAARGQHNSGAYQNAVTNTARGYLQNDNALQLAAQGAYQNLNSQKQSLYNAMKSGEAQAWVDYLTNLINSPPQDPGVVGGTPTTGGSSGNVGVKPPAGSTTLDTLGSVVRPYIAAGYRLGTTGQDTTGFYIFARQPNTGKLFKIYSDGRKVLQ